jgi:hypothetical protein
MKKIIVALSLLAVTGSVIAQPYHGHGIRHGGYYRGPSYGWWVAPVVPVVTGVIGYEIARNQQQPVIVQQQTVQTQTCTEWKEIQSSDGKIYRERTCSQ